ncbi:MAG: o-succinylbenzoate synthase [Candidatus Omnitrophica bacterium]|nr:o-succinylbenzoate synthase [Candidatus Omnitrophota bacterium]
MNIVSADVYHYSLECVRPLVLRDETLHTREGLVLHLTSDQGEEGFGEIAPLPGFSIETLDEARDQALHLRSQLCNLTVPKTIKKLNGAFDQWLDRPDLKASVRFGVESAVLGLLANAKNVSLGKLISSTLQPEIRIAGLLSGSNDEIAVAAKGLLNQGFTELKLKVGEDTDDAINKVKAVNDVAYGKALLHIDVNRAWDCDTAIAFGKKIGCAAVSYIEEPFADIRRIPEFFDETMIPVALDESVQHLTIDDIRSISGVDILVLKPTILGGIEKTKALIDQAKNCALDTTISSSFESSLGISTLVELAGTLPHSITAAGLNTLKWFKTDIFNEPVQMENGTTSAGKRAASSKDIDFSRLHRLK